MNILIDINHPAHVHYFRNLYFKLSREGHELTVVSRNKEIEQELLRGYNIPFLDRGKGASSFIGKVFYHFYAVGFLIKVIRKKRIDKIISFMHPYAAQAAWILRKPSLLFSDTEGANFHHWTSMPFTTQVHTPKWFQRDLGQKHFRFNSFMEISYLNKEFFQPDKSVLENLNLDKTMPVTVIRFVSWKAVHDAGHSGLNEQIKIELVETLANVSNVLISSESELPVKLKKYALEIDKSKIHSLLYYADLFVGESGTMTTESALLGTPAIFFNNEILGNIEQLHNNHQIVFHFKEHSDDVKKAISKSLSILEKDRERNSQVMNQYIDTTNYMIEALKSLS